MAGGLVSLPIQQHWAEVGVGSRVALVALLHTQWESWGICVAPEASSPCSEQLGTHNLCGMQSLASLKSNTPALKKNNTLNIAIVE